MIQYPDHGASIDTTFSALADPTRRQLLERLDGGPATVSMLAEPFDVTLTAIAQHLKVLESAGLIRTEKIGRQRLCTIDQAALAMAQAWIDERRTNWRGRLDRLAGHLDSTADTDDQKGA